VDLADIEQFALENLNEHKKGILGKSVPIVNMLAWTKVSSDTSVAMLMARYVLECIMLRSFILLCSGVLSLFSDGYNLCCLQSPFLGAAIVQVSIAIKVTEEGNVALLLHTIPFYA
jgi:hypothetical protein